MTPEGAGTKVDVVTDLSITGKVAQFGRGVLVDVSAKLMGQFVENLERDVLSVGGPEATPRTPAARTSRRSRARSESTAAAATVRPARERLVRSAPPAAARSTRPRSSRSTCSTSPARPSPSAWCRSGSALLVARSCPLARSLRRRR